MNAAGVSSPVIIGSILLGADEMVAAMVAARIPEVRSFQNYTALGIIKDHQLIGGVVYHGFYGHDVQVSIAVDRVGFMPWRVLFAYPFEQLGCARITSIISRKNKRARKLALLLGFSLEGVHPKGVDGTNDAFSFGMLRENCRWIKDRNNGQEVNAGPAAAA